jgi:voltage-gated potassium channel
MLRLLRLGAVARVFSMATREADEHGIQRQTWWFLAPLLVVVWVFSSVVYYSLEHGSNPNVQNLGDALYWSFITTTTVGYGDVRPVTAEGRVVAGLLVFIGIGLVGVASAQLTSRILRSEERSQDVRLDRMERHLEEMASTLSEVHHTLASLRREARAAEAHAAVSESPPELTTLKD